MFLYGKRINRSAGIEVRASILHGRGVFALTKFRNGTVIEKAPVITLDGVDKEYLGASLLYSYYFITGNEKTPAVLGLGYSSIYNHSNAANAQYTYLPRQQCLIIKACRMIKPGEEITINYNGTPDDRSAVYFNNP